MSYLVIYEKSDNGWGAYAPDLPGLGAAGQTLEETKQLIREAIQFHLEGMPQHGETILFPAARRSTSPCESMIGVLRLRYRATTAPTANNAVVTVFARQLRSG